MSQTLEGSINSDHNRRQQIHARNMKYQSIHEAGNDHIVNIMEAAILSDRSKWIKWDFTPIIYEEIVIFRQYSDIYNLH